MIQSLKNNRPAGDTQSEHYPLVSVAVVTYNQREYLHECLESVLKQDYRNFEIIVADDGSTDGTAEMLEQYASSGRGRFVIKMSSVNRGITNNQNLAQSACSGKYIAWMAGDDLMLPGKLSRQVQYLEENPEHSICYHDLEVFDSVTGRIIKRHSDVDKPREGDVRTSVRYGCFNGAVSNMVRAECQPFPAFDTRIPIASDWLYWVECLWTGGKIGYINEVLGRHRRHGSNVTSSSIRSPSLREVQDHLMSCEIIISRRPKLRREVNARRAYLMQSLRWLNDGVEYNGYLRSSLSYRFKWKVVFGLMANILFGYKR